MLQRQIMYKQLEELQRQKKLQELNDSRQQNVINQQSLIHNKQPSSGQFPPLINGTPVRDPSQMFMFGNTNIIQGFQNGLPYSQSGHGFSRFSNNEQMETVTRSSSITDHQFNGGYQETEMNTQDFTSLDPLEQKFLFNSDDTNFGNMFEETDNSQSFPSLQSGSWSALMQSALDETSSTDTTGIQEEWSGLSFQNPEPSVDNQPPNIIESRKHPSTWQNNMFQAFPSSHFQFKSDSSCHGSNQQSGNDSSGMSSVIDKSVHDSNAQTRHMLELLHKVDQFREYKHGQGQQSCLTESTQSKMIPKSETTSNNSSVSQSFGLKLSPPNFFNSSQVSKQMATSHIKNQDGQQISKSKSQPNVWVDIPSQQTHSSEGQKESTEGLINTQSFDYRQGQDGKLEESFSGRLEPNGSNSLKQSHISPHGYSPLNPTYSGSGVKREKQDSSISDHHKFPQVTSMSALTSAYENYKTVLASSATKDDNFPKSPFYPPAHDPSLKNNSFVQMNLPNTSLKDSIIINSKKRKFPTFELLPFHKEVTEGSRRLHDTSISELEWGHAVSRIPEKIKEGGEIIKKRIILTRQLMQVIFRAPPKDGMESYEMVTYFGARSALGDACSLLVNHPHDVSDTLSGKKVMLKGSGDQNLLKIVEDFIERSKKIEDVILRLENGGSVLEIRMESQDLERFSVINRFAKFHSRAHMAAPTDTTTTTSSAPKLYPQRYVTASPMPRVVPEGHNCLSL